MKAPRNNRIDWSWILGRLPLDLDELAKSTGSVIRWKNISSGEQLLMLVMVYVTFNLSLRSTGSWMSRTQDVQMANTSVLNRLRNAGGFLTAILNHLLLQSGRTLKARGLGAVLRLHDATTLSIPGSKGTDWRLHCVFVPGHGLSSVELTDAKGGESLERGHYEPNDVVIADQGLGHAKGLHALRERGAHCIVRVYLPNLPMTDFQGNRIDPQQVLDRADLGEIGRQVLVPCDKLVPLQLRLIACPMPPENAARARQKLRQKSAKKGRTPSKEALRLAGYVCLVTSVSEELLPDWDLVEIYRVRWQIELFFKRCKSLLNLAGLAAEDPALVRTYCLGKMIQVALIQNMIFFDQMVCDPQQFAPDPERPSISVWRLFHIHAIDIILAVYGTADLLDRLLRGKQSVELLREGKRKRRDASDIVYTIHRRINEAVASDRAA